MIYNIKSLSAVVAFMNFKKIPLPPPFGAVIKMDKDGLITKNLLDLAGASTKSLTSVIEHNGKLFLGSIKNHFVGVVDLKKV